MGMSSKKDGQFQRDLPAMKRRFNELEAENDNLRTSLSNLKHRLDFSETVISCLSDAVYVVNTRDFSIVDCNQVFLDRYGLTRKTVMSKPCYELKSGFDAPCNQPLASCPAMTALQTKSPICTELVLHTDDSRETNLECTAIPASRPDSQEVEVVLVERDITQHKDAQAKLKQAILELSQSNAYLTSLIRGSVDAVIAADMTGRIKIFNPAAGEITGYGEAEALNKLDIRQLYEPGMAKQIMKLLRSSRPDGRGKLKNHEVDLFHKNGERIPISLSASLVKVNVAEMGSVGFFYDLRSKKEMERELDHTRLQLLQSEKMASIGKLAAGVAHQLNNPLAGITLYTHILLEEYDLPKEAIDDLNRILRNAERSRDTVKELLQFSRQTGHEITKADLNQAMSRTLFLLQDQSLFQNIKIIRNFDPELPEVPVDLQQLNHVFMNLVLNAADAVEGNGTITVASMLSPDKESVRMEIADTGPGIAEDAMPHLFEPFFTTKEEGKGTGLGLSVAYGVIQDHGGEIWARNRKSGGAAFVFELPLESEESENGEG
jgi:two-component system NtrC family sensor kinase